MTKRSGWKHTDETRAQIRATMTTPEKRAEISERTKLRMADPAVRQRIRDGMVEATGQMDELRMLRAVWAAARPEVRSRFLSELFAPACSPSRVQAEAAS